MIDMDDIYVSIFLLTYNQEEFIEQTIESLLDQKTNFRYQIVIGEDCSADNTHLICEKFAANYPDKIKLLPSERNLGLIKNFIRTYKECNGKYVAICDGDDYWTDPLKLQKQIDFLDANPDFGIVFTSFKFLFPNSRLIQKDYSSQKSITTFEDLIFGNYISSVTAVFRNKISPTDFPRWLDTCPYGDWPLYLWTTKEGSKIKFLNEDTAVYRREVGVSEKMKLKPDSIAKANLNILEHVSKDSNFEDYRDLICESIEKHRFNLLALYIRNFKMKNTVSLSLKLGIEKPFKLMGLYSYMLKRKLQQLSTKFNL